LPIKTSSAGTAPAHRAEPRRTALVRRAGWNVGDQVLSAVTNVVMAFLVGRATDARGFGAFSAAFVVFSVLIGAERALVGQPLSIEHTKTDDISEAIRAGSATAVTIGLVSGILSLVVGALIGGLTGPALMALGVVLPGLLGQDACRMIFFAQRRPRRALLNDTVWAVLQFSAMGIVLAVGTHSAAPYILVWGASATIAAAVGWMQLGHLPDFSRVTWWVKSHGKLSGYLVAEYLLGIGAYQSGIFIIGAFTGLASIGSLRAAQVLIGPVSILTTGIMTFALPELSGRRLSAERRAKVGLVISAGVAVATIIYGALLLSVPNDVGRTLFGDTWTGASSVLLPVVVGSFALSAGLGPGINLYAMGQARLAFRLHFIEAPLLLTGVVIGSKTGGATGGAWGMAITFLLMLPIWFFTSYRVLFVYPRLGKGDAAKVEEMPAVV
jgi:O-antigen/teichoic acid export membrane protein